MNWEDIAEGAWPDNEAFAHLSKDRQLAELDAALMSAYKKQLTSPVGCYRVASVALHLLDSHELAEDRLRISLGCLLGAAASNLGKTDEAILQYKQIVQQPFNPHTEEMKAQATVALGALTCRTDPEGATRLLRKGLAAARQSGNQHLAVNASITLGSLVKQQGDLQGARRIYEQAIAEADAADISTKVAFSSIVARLHGNLANLLTDYFELHQEAILHYQEAIRGFDSAGESHLAAQRWSQLISTALKAGDLALVMETIKEAHARAGLDVESFRSVFEEMSWLPVIRSVEAEWESFLSDLLGSPAPGFDEETKATLIAARIILRAQAQDDAEVHNLAFNECFQRLPASDLRDEVTNRIIEVSKRTGRAGVLWRLRWLVESSDYELRVHVKELYHQEKAILWLGEQARLIGEHLISEAEVLLRATTEPTVFGLAAVSPTPPAWLNLNDSSKEIYSRLRVALCPPLNIVQEEIHEIVSACQDAYGQVKPDRLDLLIPYTKWADLTGQPQLQISARTLLAQALSKQEGELTPSSYRACLNLLNEALRVAEGLTREEIRIRVSLGTIHKEARFGDEASRLDNAVSELKQALTIAKDGGFADAIPAIAVTLGNAISEHPLVNEALLKEAEEYLREGLAAVTNKEEASQEMIKGVLYNSLGRVYMGLAEFARPRENFIAAITHLEKALAIREALGDQEKVLLTLGNLIGAKLKLRGMCDETSDEIALTLDKEIISLSEYVRAVAPRSQNIQSKAGSLLNAATALSRGGYREALEIGLEVLDIVRTKGVTKLLIDAYIIVGEIHTHFGEHETARGLFEEGIIALDSFREAGGDSKYRASLTTNYQSLHDSLIKSLEAVEAPSDELWWAIEQGSGKTLIENMVTRGLMNKPSKESIVGQLTRYLPPNCLLFQIYQTSTRVGVFVIRTMNGVFDVRLAESNIPLPKFAEETGGFIKDGKLSTPIFTPAYPQEFKRQLAWLGEKFLEPLLKEVELSGIARIVIVAQGFLHNLAWHAVPLLQQNKRLGDLFEVIQVPSVSILAKILESQSRPLQKAVFVACDPGRTLTHHIKEVRQAFSALEVPYKVVLTDQSRPITRDAFMSAIADADLLHFSGHGIFEHGSPEQSGLLLSDGVVSVQRLEEAFSAYVPSVVILSSCDSAKNDLHLSDAPTLSTIFLQAGARMVVGAPWPVPDIVAAETTRSFYKLLPSMGPTRALCETRRSLRRTHAHDYWDSFIIQGWD